MDSRTQKKKLHSEQELKRAKKTNNPTTGGYRPSGGPDLKDAEIKFLHGDYSIPDGYLRRSRRDPSKLDQRLARTSSASSTLFVQAPTLWNSLPDNARRAPDVAVFKTWCGTGT
ncbi:hypothetical protein HPB47_002142 [Ixodes persulcatus]|uniref:Uncharacterized protein n=1 Tax=Ixodes persulcatus TaxID=34615 RepID=A0AC60PM13_IXOPE|nr:hypothetical protein HPB47_002142 [Ixodes persulcatus]